MKSLKLFVAAALLGTLATTARAQRVGSIRLGVSGGGTVALHDVSSYNADGFNFGIHAIFPTALRALAVRIEVLHNQLGKNEASDAAKTLVTSAGPGVELSPGSIPLFMTPARGPAITPFLSLGAGAYHVHTSFKAPAVGVMLACVPGNSVCGFSGFPTPSGSLTRFGWNAGGGLRFPVAGFSTFVEARYHHISTHGSSFLSRSISFAPLSFGVTF